VLRQAESNQHIFIDVHHLYDFSCEQHHLGYAAWH
jgi:hypothetical protein